MNEATRTWEYKHPPKIAAESRDKIECPKCSGRLQWQDEFNLACLQCDGGYGVGPRASDADGLVLFGESGHPVAEVLYGD